MEWTDGRTDGRTTNERTNTLLIKYDYLTYFYLDSNTAKR